MDISSIASDMQAGEIETQYAVKLIKMIQQSDEVVASILEDTAEISEEAMEKYLSEIGR